VRRSGEGMLLEVQDAVGDQEVHVVSHGLILGQGVGPYVEGLVGVVLVLFVVLELVGVDGLEQLPYDLYEVLWHIEDLSRDARVPEEPLKRHSKLYS
jgi:hypothetical protein